MESWNVGWDILKDPKIQSILIVGCGGGFDFVHSLLIYEDLIHLKKEIYVGSYSFGNPHDYSAAAAPALQPIFSHSYHQDTPNTDPLDPTISKDVICHQSSTGFHRIARVPKINVLSSATALI